MPEEIRPNYYNAGSDDPFEFFEVIKQWFTAAEVMGFYKITAMKYLMRNGKKPTAGVIEDFLKAETYSAAARRWHAQLEDEIRKDLEPAQKIPATEKSSVRKRKRSVRSRVSGR